MKYLIDEYKRNASYQLTKISHLKSRILNAQRIGMPDHHGIYLVLREHNFKPEFISEGTAGFYKRLNPNIDIQTLKDNWIEQSHVLYIGKAGGVHSNGQIDSSTLEEKITSFIKFGMGNNTSHWSGRFIWQIKNADNLYIAYWQCRGINPVEAEKEMLRDYYLKYDRLPFGNVRY